MKKRFYLAYGSNLNVDQMQNRCPTARIVGTANLQGYELLFKGSKTGSYLTIEQVDDGTVPVAVWEVQPKDEARLDVYEGFPSFYYKKDIRICMKSTETGRKRTVNAFAYIMHEDRPRGVPGLWYVQTCLDGYDSFGFDRKYLFEAYRKSRRTK